MIPHLTIIIIITFYLSVCLPISCLSICPHILMHPFIPEVFSTRAATLFLLLLLLLRCDGMIAWRRHHGGYYMEPTWRRCSAHWPRVSNTQVHSSEQSQPIGLQMYRVTDSFILKITSKFHIVHRLLWINCLSRWRHCVQLLFSLLL